VAAHLTRLTLPGIGGVLAMGFSSGAAAIISRALGAQNKALAARSVSDGLFLTITGTIVVSIAGDMMRPTVVMFVVAILNVILDPILMFGFGTIPAMANNLTRVFLFFIPLTLLGSKISGFTGLVSPASPRATSSQKLRPISPPASNCSMSNLETIVSIFDTP
jgi:Na+-driven multidrug efflux pump